MRKIVYICIVVFTMLAVSGCNGAEQNIKNEKLSIVTTIFPEYDWAREITKGNESAQITMLLDKGVDLHSFQPSAEDIITLTSADVLIYVGGESDKWIEEALAENGNDDMVVINLLDKLGNDVKEEELVEGMQGENESEKENEEEPEYDEHVWLSVKSAKAFCEIICDEIIKIDEDNAELYTNNTKTYITLLDDLDKAYEDCVSSAKVKTILFGDRFPFRYLVDDYGLSYYAAFVGCSAESEASFDTITFLSEKVDELGLEEILQIESSDGKIAQTIINSTTSKNQEILTMDSMQSVTAEDVAAGTNYIEIMKNNLEVLQKALD